MTKLLVVLMLAAMVILGGCTLMESPQEHGRRIEHITDLNLRMAMDDIDHILLYEHTSRLTEWRPRVGP